MKCHLPDRRLPSRVVEDVKSPSDEELLTEYYDAIHAIPGIADADAEARRSAWDAVLRYHDELMHRYPPTPGRLPFSVQPRRRTRRRRDPQAPRHSGSNATAPGRTG